MKWLLILKTENYCFNLISTNQNWFYCSSSCLLHGLKGTSISSSIIPNCTTIIHYQLKKKKLFHTSYIIYIGTWELKHGCKHINRFSWSFFNDTSDPVDKCRFQICSLCECCAQIDSTDILKTCLSYSLDFPKEPLMGMV